MDWSTDEDKKHYILIIKAVDGQEFYGPFDTFAEMQEYHNRYFEDTYGKLHVKYIHGEKCGWAVMSKPILAQIQ